MLLNFLSLAIVCFALISPSHVLADGGTAREYLIWPRANLTRQGADSVQKLLQALTSDRTRLYASEIPRGSIPSFWLAVLDGKSRVTVLKHPWVVEIDLNEDHALIDDVSPRKVTGVLPNLNTTMPVAEPAALQSLTMRRSTFHQRNGPDELRVISQTPGTLLAENPDYAYSIDESEETFIYDIGEGINRAHYDFSDPKRKIEWLYTPQIKLKHYDTPTELPFGEGLHSTCTASKAAGMLAGSARHATLVVVKWYPNAASIAEVIQTVSQDIVAKGRTHHSVVSFSYSSEFSPRYWRKLAEDIMLLVRRGVPVVVAAGNDGGFVNELPASLADRTDNLMGPIVVGAVDNEGNRALFSAALRYGRMLWAPGVAVSCADSMPEIRSFMRLSGTSYAAPLVAGVIAEELTEMNRQGLFHPARRNEFILDALQWKRDSGLPVIWNGGERSFPLKKGWSRSNGTAAAKRYTRKRAGSPGNQNLIEWTDNRAGNR